MIGQEKVIKLLKESEGTPFILLVGAKHFGKKTLLRELYSHAIWYSDCKIDSVRNMIQVCHDMYDSTIIMPDIDEMSPGAKNAILKLIEETPNNNQIIMTCCSLDNVLSTIKSRAQIFYMDMYTANDLKAYIEKLYGDLELFSKNQIIQVCHSPGQIEEIMAIDSDKLFDLVNRVVARLIDIPLSNAFKLGENLALKSDSNGYDLELFWRVFDNTVMNRLMAIDVNNQSEIDVLIHMHIVTFKYMLRLNIKGINKSMLFGAWVVEMQNIGR